MENSCSCSPATSGGHPPHAGLDGEGDLFSKPMTQLDASVADAIRTQLSLLEQQTQAILELLSDCLPMIFMHPPPGELPEDTNLSSPPLPEDGGVRGICLLS